METWRELIEDKCVRDENNKISSYPSKDVNTTVSEFYSFKNKQTKPSLFIHDLFPSWRYVCILENVLEKIKNVILIGH